MFCLKTLSFVSTNRAVHCPKVSLKKYSITITENAAFKHDLILVNLENRNGQYI